MKAVKFLFLALMCLTALNLNAQQYVDLGLPSGTLWKTSNEKNKSDDHGYYTYNKAVRVFGKQLPTKEQWVELENECAWTWDDSKGGYVVMGSNGNSLFLPAAGYRNGFGSVLSEGYGGGYWSSTSSGKEDAWNLSIDQKGHGMYEDVRAFGQSVRLVKPKN